MNEKVSEIQIMPIKPKDGLVAFASFIYNNSFYFGNIAIYTKIHGGYRLNYPTKKVGNGIMPLYYPINKKIADEIEKIVIEKYESLITKELYD